MMASEKDSRQANIVDRTVTNYRFSSKIDQLEMGITTMLDVESFSNEHTLSIGQLLSIVMIAFRRCTDFATSKFHCPTNRYGSSLSIFGQNLD